MLYPVHLQLKGRGALVVGGGAVAARKVAGLRAAGATVRVVSPDVTPALAVLAEAGEIDWRHETYGTGALDGVFLVLACTDNGAVNAQVTRDAAERRLLVLCADDPDAGSFVSPTAIRRGDLLLTVSTGGSSPTLAAVLREQLENEFGPEWGALTESIRRMRGAIKALPDEAARKAAVRRVLDDPEVHRRLAAGENLEAEARIQECLSLFSE